MKITLECQHCGSTFTRDLSPSKLAQGSGKYCSRACHIEARRGKPLPEERKERGCAGTEHLKKRISLICPTCKTAFESTPRLVARVASGKHYCLAACARIGRRGTRMSDEARRKLSIAARKKVGPKNHQWRG